MTDKPRPKVPREPRRELHKQPAWITVDNGMTKRECFVLDVAPGGAKIMTDAAIDVSDTLGLELVSVTDTPPTPVIVVTGFGIVVW